MKNVFEMENFLIEPKYWDFHYKKMPQKCQNIVDESKKYDPYTFAQKMGGPIGIGYKGDIGFFILGTGQGPHVIFQEFG